MAYTRVNWQDIPSTATPMTAANLNQMDSGIYNIDATLNIRQGTWTPTLISINGNDPTYIFEWQEDGRTVTGYRYARYYTVGKLCYITFSIKTHITNAGTNYAGIGGLPFSSINSDLEGQALAMGQCLGAITSGDYDYTTANVMDNSKKIDLCKGNGGARAAYLTGTVWIDFSGVYLMA